MFPHLDQENQTRFLDTQIKLIKIFPLTFIGLAFFLSFPMLLDHFIDSYHGIKTYDGTGLWKISKKGKTEYCEVVLDTNNQPQEGKCIPVYTITP